MDVEMDSLSPNPWVVKAEMQALLKLIDEPDEGNFTLIRHKLLDYGSVVLGPLEGLLDHYFDDDIQSRIMRLIHDIQFQEVFDRLSKWASAETHNLLKGFFIVSCYQYPHLVYKDIHAKIDLIIRDVWLEINEDLTALEKIKVLNHIMFDIHHFRPNKEEMHDPQNFFLNTVLDTRKGSPLALGIIYMLVGRSLGIPIYGVNLPQHFVLAYTREGSLEKDVLPGSQDVLFYINPFNLGSVFTQHEIDLFLKQLKQESKPEFYTPCANTAIIRRMINNLIFAYIQGKKTEKVEDMKRLLEALPEIPSEEDALQG